MGARSQRRVPYKSEVSRVPKTMNEFLNPPERMVCGCDPKRPRHSLMCMAKLSGEKT